MGLDVVELVMACEDAFGISIPDQAASKVLTVGDLYDLILQLTASRPEGAKGCASSTFYRLRQGLVACGLERDCVLPASRLEDLLPAQQRKVLWSQLSRATGMKLPALQVPGWSTHLVYGCAAAVAVVAWVMWRRIAYAAGAGVAVLVLGGLCVWPWRRAFPHSCQTLEGLVYAVIGRNREALAGDKRLGPRETWNVLRQIIAEQLGVDEKDIQAGTRFREDLNVG